MSKFRTSAAFFALAALVATAPALADTFTLNPGSVGLDGTSVTTDTLVLSDYAQISFTPTGPTTATFMDVGYLPVIGFQLNGQAVAPAGYLAQDGSGWGAYIRYVGTGTQTLSPAGLPAATYQTLTYDFVGYNGLATFGAAADGSAMVGGAISNVTTLDSGSLISGSLAFLPAQSGPTINGQVQEASAEANPQFFENYPGGLDVNFIHPAGEYFFTSAVTLQIAGGMSSTATIVTAATIVTTGSGSGDLPASVGVPVPEPASAALLGIGLAGVAGLRKNRRASAPPVALPKPAA